MGEPEQWKSTGNERGSIEMALARVIDRRITAKFSQNEGEICGKS
jgi:hypothetical protein